ncbi:hypothetical protein Ddye_027893 [Dipteronia dyeriana]|uniref:Uncharacterized protein n=1 Tax=Dipteronia dyeriana TaxID=168575 RepID=A0AAD9WRW0_9ROSI|nr:hypothetical protein Ddye_027893 [Dipteronia dyeriana]
MAETSITSALAMEEQGLILAAFMGLSAFFSMAETSMITMLWPWKGPALNVISELIIGYLYPGKPLANVTFKIYSTISMGQALDFLSDFKLGHYMKIPPKSMFIAQIPGQSEPTPMSGLTRQCEVNKLIY